MYPKTRVAAYCRVSTDKEDQIHSLTSQIQYFTEHINQHEGWELVEVYYDEGITGTSVKKRDGFNRMIADCEDGKVDTILTKEVSRFARNTVDTLNYTRHLKQLKVNVIFMNDGIDTDDKDGELRLTIMASIAQEESRKISERVKWGVRRKMENGYVFGYSKLLGYRNENGSLVVVPEEAEVVRRIFHEYVYERKGTFSIARDLNRDGIRSVKGGIFRQDSLVRILRNEKYCGDLVQWKRCSIDFLTKKVIHNQNENPDTPVIALEDHHEAIISKELFYAAQELLDERGQSAREGRRFSSTYWFSNKVVCGKCGTHFSKTGSKKIRNPMIRCSNRAAYGTEPHVCANGRHVGCNNGFITENILKACVRYVLMYVREEREQIEKQLIEDICEIQKKSSEVDPAPLKAKIDKLNSKKQSAVDLMIEGIISKEDLKRQVTQYDAEIEELTIKIANGKNMNETHHKQICAIREYIEQINQTGTMDIDSTEVYAEIVREMVSYEDDRLDVYLSCIPFGFRLRYHREKTPHCHFQTIVVDECTTI